MGKQGVQIGTCDECSPERAQPLRVIGQQRGEFGQQRERVTQPGKIAGARVSQCNAPTDAFDVGAALECAGECGGGVGALQQRADGVAPMREDFAVAQGMVQPVPQQARAHAGGGGVEHAQQRRRGLAAQRFGELQVAPRGGVELDELAVALGVDRLDMGEGGALGDLDVVEQRARGGDALVQVGHAEAGEVAAAELLRQALLRTGGVELPWREAAHRARRGEIETVRRKDFRRPHARQQRGQGGGRDFADLETPRGKVEPSRAQRVVANGNRHDQRVARLVQQARIGQCPRCDDARDLTLDGAFRRRRVAHLLGDHHRLAQLQQAREILLGAVIRHPGHPDRRAGRRAACGERDVQEPRRLLRVIEEQLVEIAHAIEQQHIGMLRLDAEILLHHGRVLVYCLVQQSIVQSTQKIR